MASVTGKPIVNDTLKYIFLIVGAKEGFNKP